MRGAGPSRLLAGEQECVWGAPLDLRNSLEGSLPGLAVVLGKEKPTRWAQVT